MLDNLHINIIMDWWSVVFLNMFTYTLTLWPDYLYNVSNTYVNIMTRYTVSLIYATYIIYTLTLLPEQTLYIIYASYIIFTLTLRPKQTLYIIYVSNIIYALTLWPDSLYAISIDHIYRWKTSEQPLCNISTSRP